MTRTREIFRSQWMYLWLAIALTLASFTPAVSNTRLLADSYGSLAAFDSAQALPSWYLSTAVSRVDTPDSYQPLPSWWSRASAAATAPIAPMAATIVASFDVTVPLTATAGVPFPTEIQALDDGGSPLSVAATVAITTNSGQSITPKTVDLVAGVATPDVTLTAADTDRLVKVISGTATGQATITVLPAPASSLTVTPDSAVVQVGRTRTFTATGTDAFGNTASVAPLWTTNWGTVNPDRNYYTIFTADTEPAAGKLVTATENEVNANAVVDIVHGPFHHFGITPDPIGTRTAGTPFDLTVEAQDEYGNRVPTFDAAVDLDDSTGTITEDTISLGEGIGTTNVAITRAGTGIVISATAGVTTTATDGFTVVPNGLHHVRVNNVASNGGASFGGPVEMGSRTIDIYGHIDAWAGGYDEYDNYRGDVSVTWEGTGLVGQGEFIPTSGISTTFTPAPVLSGNGTIRAVNAVPPAEDESGQINIQAPKLAISKVGEPSPVPAGGFLQYTIIYTNVGNTVAQGVRITETYDLRVTRIGGTPPDEGQNVWTSGNLGAGESDEILVVVQVDNSLVPGTVLTNVVSIGGLRLERDTFTETTAVISTPDLTMTLDSNPNPVAVGGNLVYQIHYENQGNAPVTNATITVTYDSRVTFHSWSGDGELKSGNSVWDLGSIPADAGGDISIVVRVDEYIEDGADLDTSAFITSDEFPEGFHAFASTAVNAPVLELSKSAMPSPVEADAQLVYTLVYSNVGHLDTTALSITDAVPADTDYVSCLPSSICSRIGDIVVWQPGSLAPGAKRTATMVVNVRRNLDSGTVLTNTARARVINEEAYSATAQITTTVLGQPLLWLSIGNGVDEVEAGDALEYTLHYSNTGNANAYSTTIVVTPPSSQYVEDVDCEPSSACDPDDGQLVYSLGTVPGGVTGTLRMVASVKHPLPAGADRIVASATINTPTPGDPPQGNDAADEDAIATRPDLVVLVDYEDKMPWPGKRVTYTLSYVNIGHIATNDVWITVTSNPNAEFRGKTSSPGWIARGDGIYSYYVGDMGYPDGGELLFVVTLANTTFTTQTTDFDSTFEISDSGVSGEDANPSNNRYDAWLGVPDIVIEKVTVEPSVWRGEAGLLKATLRNVGTGDACGIYNPTGCVGFVLDPYLDPDTPPSSYPIDGFGDCFIEVFPIKPGIAKTVEISFTALPRSQWPAYESGLCEASALNEIWLKVDNWDPAVAPYPDGSGWVPESNEYNNVYGPITPETELFLPLIMRRFMGP